MACLRAAIFFKPQSTLHVLQTFFVDLQYEMLAQFHTEAACAVGA